MIRQLVVENLVALDSIVPRARRPSWLRSRRLLTIGLPLLLTGVLWVVASGATSGPAPEPSLPRRPIEAVSRVASGAASLESGGDFPAPSPHDAKVFPLQVRRVVLDPGHGGADNPGTVGPDGTPERELTLDIAQRLRRLLEEFGYEVVMTRVTDVTVPLEERTRVANDVGADIFISIHVNWLANQARGIETFFLGPIENPGLVSLTSLENRESGYSLAALRSILEGVYTNVRRDESRRLAEAVHRNLRWHVGQVAPEVTDRGVKTAPFVVLVGTEMPAVLVEVSALSHEEDARLLKLAAYRQYIALALYSGIRAYSEGLRERDDQTS